MDVDRALLLRKRRKEYGRLRNLERSEIDIRDRNTGSIPTDRMPDNDELRMDPRRHDVQP